MIQLSEQNPDWILGFVDEVWWSRLRDPMMPSWAEEAKPLPLVEKTTDPAQDEPKAIACYGIDLRSMAQVLVRFALERPVSKITCQFLEWLCQQVRNMGKRVLPILWDHATWHLSKQVQRWIRTHNQTVKQTGIAARLIICRVPVEKSLVECD